MSSLMKKITGALTGPDGNRLTALPMGISVELTVTDAQSPGGWIGSAPVAAGDAGFELFTTYDVQSEELLTYRLLRSNQVVDTGDTTVTDLQLNITLPDEVITLLTEAEDQGTIVIKGQVSLKEGNMPAIPVTQDSIAVTVHKLRFRNTQLLGQGKIDAWGNYEIKIARRLMLLATGTPAACQTQPLAALYVSVYNGTSLLTRSADMTPADCCTTVDLNVSNPAHFSLFRSELDDLCQLITAHTGIAKADLKTVKTGIGESEIPAVAAVTQKDESELLLVILAAKTAAELGITLDHAYALCKSAGIDYAAWANLDLQQLTGIITRAVAEHTITLTGNIEATYALLHDQKMDFLLQDQDEEGHTVETLMASILTDAAQIKQFVELSLQYEGNVQGLWNSVQAAMGENTRKKLQQGLQVLAISGMQPEMTASLTRSNMTMADIAVTWTEQTWLNKINQVSLEHGKLCVPLGIQKEAPGNESDMKAIYAKRLLTLTTDIYAMAVLGSKYASGALTAQEPEQTPAFIQQHPELDLRFSNIWETDMKAQGFNEEVKQDLLPVQNLLRLTNGKPEAVTEMLLQGIKSSSDIAELSEDQFLHQYTIAKSLLSTQDAKQVYSKAVHTSLSVAQLKATIQPNNSITSVLTDLNWQLWIKNPGASTNPDLQTLFGSMDLCSCSECMSMYSPAAYFTDMLHVLHSKLGLTLPSTAFTELDRRRTDLVHIELSCKNTNTVLPYIDLVNEQLELVILRHMASQSGSTITFVPDSFQTTGTAQELEAYPEHTYKEANGSYQKYEAYTKVYDEVLRQEVYPRNLPFDLAAEEARTYFGHLGYSRNKLAERLKPATGYEVLNGTTGINEYNTLAEMLGLTKKQADIISTVSGSPWLYYGLESNNWITALTVGLPAQGLKTLLHHAEITYTELQQLLETTFLNKKYGNGSRPLTINPIVATNTGTCQLDELKLTVHANANAAVIFEKWHRFIRLSKATGWSIYTLDRTLAALGITELNEADFVRLAKVHAATEMLRTSPEKLSAAWSDISTEIYKNYAGEQANALPSVYDELFRNKTLINPPDEAFDNFQAIVGTYKERSGTILAAFNITEEELYRMLLFMGIDVQANPATAVTLTALSRVLGLLQMAKGLNMPVNDYLLLLRLAGTNGPDLLTASATSLHDQFFNLLTFAAKTRSLLFPLEETAYLVTHLDAKGVYNPANEAIQLFYEALRADLKKLVGDNLEDIPNPSDLRSTLENVVIQAFSNQLGTDMETAGYLLKYKATINSNTLPLPDALLLPAFINATLPSSSLPLPVTEGAAIPAFAFSELYNAYRRLSKVTRISNRYGLSKTETEFFLGHTTQLDIPDFADLPLAAATPAATATLVAGLVRLNDWIRVKGILQLKPATFTELLSLSAGTGSKTDWVDYVADITQWDKTDLQYLAGTNNTTYPGLLRTTYSATPASNDYRKGALVLQLAGIAEATGRIGLSASQIYEALKADLEMADSGNIRKAAKAKHQEEDWLKIARPLQNTLREKQREALVAYVVAHPDVINEPVGSNLVWKNENGLFAYLLIDTAMQPCMKTSRIKQAISTVQLFMDRLILNLENTGGNALTHITITPEMSKQWKEWRKWYRIWEANRKIFLYPENWIEPELRGDKTPFFKELETQLLQDEVKEKTAEDAMRAYLEQVAEIGRLEPVGTYHQLETTAGQAIDRIHVFGKTSSIPHRYFYRRLEDNEWSPWEKVNADIKSDHVVPAMWNRKLYLFWLTFKKKKRTAEEMPKPKAGVNNQWINNMKQGGLTGTQAGRFTETYVDGNNDAYNIWEITLNWSEYKDGKWLATEISKDTMSIDMTKAIMSDRARASLQDIPKTVQVLSWLNNREEIKIDDFFKNRLFLYHTPEGLYPNERYGINFSIMLAHGLDEVATGIHSFVWRGDNSQDPYVGRINYERGYQLIAPEGTRINKMKFAEDPYGDGKLVRDNTYYNYNALANGPNAQNPANTYFSYDTGYQMTFPGIIRGNKQVILNTTAVNGRFQVTARSGINGNPHSHYHNPLLSEFLFEDEKNTFFVRWEPTGAAGATAAVVQTGNISFAAANNLATEVYQQAATAVVANSYLSGNNFVQASPQHAYKFHTFYHAQIKDFLKVLNRDGLDGLLNISLQKQDNTMAFPANYQPTSLVHSVHPRNNVQFGFNDAYSIYNWEIFFHAPMMIAQRLSDNQQFDEAQKWYHYVFNPTSNTDIGGQYNGAIKRFWKFYPFYAESQQTPETLLDLLIAINQGDPEAQAQVLKWEKNPFQPHVIARMRILAYMKNVLMKYIDNLVAWGDQLFRRDTIESVNEATQLYVLAANLLGERPQQIPPRNGVSPKTFDQLNTGAGFDLLSNSLVAIESYFTPNTPSPAPGSSSGGTALSGKMFYFCLPKNDKLMGYWDTVADRLFKIRHCMNIDGTVRQLPLFEPPVDPALLVRATAMGVDINSILDAVSGSNLPHYRFAYMLQKANEVCGDVRGLGNALLSALEKKDAEQLALLRSGQELKMLEKIRFIKEQQVAEAEQALEAMRLTKENTQLRFSYYSSRPFTNANEQKHLQSIQEGLVLQAVQGAMQSVASGLSTIPQFHAQTWSSIGPSFGGQQLAAATNAMSANVGILASINNAKGSMAATQGGYERRRDDWTFQADTAGKELEQLDKQILGAEIRLDIARRELANHELQMENSTEVDQYMRSKFSNQELYSWMSNQVAATYFQSYQLAYDLARKTEECYRYELKLAPTPAGGFIKFGYWDSLRKGLMSGEKLQFDLRKMETVYMESNKRELELTKSVSLVFTDPQALLDLRDNGSCNFRLPEELFDLDYPGHYLRRIKSVSISLPCIAGPYTTVPATLTLNSSAIRTTDLVPGEAVTESYQARPSIATSGGQNDSGVFELNFRDERYLPFEGRGVVNSEWNLHLADPAQVRMFDFSTISDVILQVKYTALEGKTTDANGKLLLRENRVANINSLLAGNLPGAPLNGALLPRYFSLKHEFSTAWQAALKGSATTFSISLEKNKFPEFAKGKTITISSASFHLRTKNGIPDPALPGNSAIVYKLNGDPAPLASFTIDSKEVDTNIILAAGAQDYTFTLTKEINGQPQAISEAELSDLFLVLYYKLG